MASACCGTTKRLNAMYVCRSFTLSRCAFKNTYVCDQFGLTLSSYVDIDGEAADQESFH